MKEDVVILENHIIQYKGRSNIANLTFKGSYLRSGDRLLNEGIIIDLKENEDIERKLIAFPKYEEQEEIISRINENKLDKWVWATPGLPLLIFITAGLIIALIYGDIIWFLIGIFLN